VRYRCKKFTLDISSPDDFLFSMKTDMSPNKKVWPKSIWNLHPI